MRRLITGLVVGAFTAAGALGWVLGGAQPAWRAVVEAVSWIAA